MRLYVIEPESNQKIYLKLVAESRNKLADLIKGNTFHVNGCSYKVEDVMAEPDHYSLTTGAVVGGLVGILVFGAIGLGAGAVLGNRFGNRKFDKDRIAADMFNKSSVGVKHE